MGRAGPRSLLKRGLWGPRKPMLSNPASNVKQDRNKHCNKKPFQECRLRGHRKKSSPTHWDCGRGFRLLDFEVLTLTTGSSDVPRARASVLVVKQLPRRFVKSINTSLRSY